MTSVVGSERLDSDVTSHRTLVGVRVKDLAELAGTTVRSFAPAGGRSMCGTSASGTPDSTSHRTRISRVRWANP